MKREDALAQKSISRNRLITDTCLEATVESSVGTYPGASSDTWKSWDQ